MQVTQELLDNEIKSVETQLENAKASVASTTGALVVLKGIRDYLNKEGPKPEPDISSVNKEIQELEQLVQEAELEALASEEK